MQKVNTLIIGGGPAGLMAANRLDLANHPYLLLEKKARVGTKLLLTGNSRCNVTNHLAPNAFIQTLTFKHRRFLYGAISQFNHTDIINFFKARGVPLVLEENFKYFPKSGKSNDILNALLQDIQPQKILTNQTVQTITKENDHYLVRTQNQTFIATHVIIATGSHSFPHTGSEGDGKRFANQLHIPFIPFTPAETVVYSLEAVTLFKDVQGTVLKNVRVKVPGVKNPLKGDVLLTHFGLSGPLIMHASEFIYEALNQNQPTIHLALLDMNQEDLINLLLKAKQENQTLKAFLLPYFTKRFTQTLLTIIDKENPSLASISDKQIRRYAQMLLAFPITIDKVQNKEKAYVNKGGFSTKAINSSTMAVKTHPNLYVCGETLDVHGPIGGYNITIALSTAYLASQAIIKNSHSEE